MSPPTSLDAVQSSVDELRAKKEWYSQQPRGSVPTARDIRKKNAAAAAANGTSAKAAGTRGGKKGGKFDISNDSEFAPLDAGSSSAASS